MRRRQRPGRRVAVSLTSGAALHGAGLHGEARPGGECGLERLPGFDAGGPVRGAEDEHVRAGLRRVRLAGLQNAPAPSIRPGDTLEVPLVWQVLEPSPRPLVRFVHLLRADGKPLAQHDSAPCEGECPSPSWLAGEVLTDTVTLTIPEDAPAGGYSLAAGWYDGETLQRLEARDAEGTVLPDGLVPLANVEVAK